MADQQLELHCLSCGYSLRGIDSQRCPECGTIIDREGLSLPGIPWERRKSIGKIRAYWRTVRMVIFRPRHFAESVARPIYADARRFQHITVLMTYVPVLIAGIWILADNQQSEFHDLAKNFSKYPLGWALEAGLLPICAFSVWLFFFTATGVASYFFHPRAIPVARQNRAITLSYYACASLALTPAIALAILVVLVLWEGIGQPGGWIAPYLLGGLTAVLIGVQIASLWRVPLVLLMRTTSCSGARTFALAIFLPLAWLFLAAVILVGIPAAYLFVSIVILSLR